MESLKEINDLTREAYNKAAAEYYRLFKDEMNEKEFDRKLLDNFAGCFDSNSILCDAGCGPAAHIGRYMADKGLKVIGTDISDECIKIASANNPDMEFFRNDFFEWNFPDRYFDGIISYYSIMYTPRIYLDKLISVFSKALKPNGKLLLVAKEGSSEGYEDELLGIKSRIYTSYFSGDEIKAALKNNRLNASYFFIRKPLESEIKINRIYVIAIKI